MRTCSDCFKTFSHAGDLRHHRQLYHQLEKRPPVHYFCYYCNFKTLYKYNLSKHVKAHLTQKRKKTRNNNVCSLCGTFECVDRKLMVDHYKSAHEVLLNEQTLNFNSWDQFLAWKLDTENAECCKFVMRDGKKQRERFIVSKYRCFRDGHFLAKGSGTRRLKLKGSCRINGICPASLTARKHLSSGAVSVRYIAAHVGHYAEIGRLNLTLEEKNEIAHKLAAGVPIGTILDSLRESINNGEVNRIHLTTRKDLWNIRNTLHLQNGSTLHADDRTSVEAWLSTG
ncbi:hypothetical protein GE061_011539 [Apolygus lucorum]|uniref:C2H2-type domain-containing protein n=1 Tax=Apolygus lucorum TaxID=248454 RepID=A0A8S9XY38_APOLU|nr:hypothetical protein GE061_011539 [Apolygus lucorum]